MSLLRGAIDLHVHSHPDTAPRRLDDLELVEQARAAGLRGVLLKSHGFSTCERAYLLRRLYPDFHTFGGIALNDAVGGLNPVAVEVALELGAAQVWMPTKSAANHTRHLGGDGRLAVTDDAQTLKPDVREILDLVAAHDVILGTGHLAPEETALLVSEALAAGVERVLVTHPEWGVTAVPVAWQQAWAATGRVFFERCLVSTATSLPQHVPFSVIAEQIRAVGPETTVASTDYGLDRYPPPVEGLKTYVRQLSAAGFTDDEIRLMVQRNPAFLLKLEPVPIHDVSAHDGQTVS